MNASTNSSVNALAGETSPYLLQHADNPVDWRPWNTEALEEAARSNKPILLSIGYAACHWCHVMAHESFSDPEIAKVMNDRFVNIKVDREERPDLDQIYQAALAMLGQQGGWPLTMFLTPKGEPFWGGTYFPPTGRWGRPGFPDVLKLISSTYADDSDAVSQNVTALQAGLEKLNVNQGGDRPSREIVERCAGQFLEEIDTLHGGIGQAPKFPHTEILRLLWQTGLRTGDAGMKEAVVLSLTAMCQGGIYDHLGGGFARYATDREWLAPHFEKMLYDNTLLIELLVQVWRRTRLPLLEARIRETVTWLIDEMSAEGGAFAASFDADSEGEEGRFYVWRVEEVELVLGQDAALFATHYDVTEEGNWEGWTILNRRRATASTDDRTEALLADCRRRLKKTRDRRVWPARDDKVLADWNGLAMTALARAGQVLGERLWIERAAEAFAFVKEAMSEEGRLRHSFRAGRAAHTGQLEDYANMADAALALHEATGEEVYRDDAVRWVEILDRWFWDSANGGYFQTAADADPLIVRPKTAHDGAVPSGNGTMIGVLARLALLTGDTGYADRAETLAAAFGGEVERNVFPLASFLANLAWLDDPLQIVIVGELEDLHRMALDQAPPASVIVAPKPDEPLPAGHPAAGKQMVDGQPTVYVCRGMTCSPPTTDAAGLESLLTETPN